MAGYPIEIDLAGRSALVVGLGRVGLRKAAGLADAGADVVSVDPRVGIAVPVGVEHRVEPFRPAHLEGMSLAFAAATADVNRFVVSEAKNRGVWVNAASEPDAGDFTVPAIWRNGPIVLTVSTSGASPALARALRDRASASIAGAAGLAQLIGELRVRAATEVRNSDARRRLLKDWGDPKRLDQRLAENLEATRSAMLSDLSAASELPESEEIF